MTIKAKIKSRGNNVCSVCKRQIVKKLRRKNLTLCPRSVVIWLIDQVVVVWQRQRIQIAGYSRIQSCTRRSIRGNIVNKHAAELGRGRADWYIGTQRPSGRVYQER